ncbi:hypothetical protein [Halorubrum amylolyticum]|uniref:hypothetical protein n=1 Tax=Halorubrum amylolyticum TaxID=2508724 RepID=UPI0013E8D6E2|nr:hypothetical protein [Halorubrum amylolyticum]
MGFDTSGFDDLEDSLELVDGENEIEFEELFSHSFMRQYTKVEKAVEKWMADQIDF